MKRNSLFLMFLFCFTIIACSDDDDLLAPIANFSIENNNCFFPCEVSFTNTTIGDEVELQWDFGDGASSLETNPAHTYTDKGTYTVTLNALNDAGFNQIKKEVTILEE